MDSKTTRRNLLAAAGGVAGLKAAADVLDRNASAECREVKSAESYSVPHPDHEKDILDQSELYAETNHTDDTDLYGPDGTGCGRSNL